jgi:hypothetical protein
LACRDVGLSWPRHRGFADSEIVVAKRAAAAHVGREAGRMGIAP